MNKEIYEKIFHIASFQNGAVQGNAEETVIFLAKNHPDFFAEELHKITEQAAKFWELANNRGVDDVTYHKHLQDSESLYDMVDSLVAPLGMVTDRGVGLYPSYQVTIDGEEYTEYTPLNALRRYNGFYK